MNIDRERWDKVADLGRDALHLSGGEVGLLFIERDGAAAAILLGSPNLNDQRVVKCLKLFHDRLGDMIEHAESGELSLQDGGKTYIRDSLTGEYQDPEHPGFAG